LTDHLRSVIRNATQKINVTDFYANGIQILRDVILGKAEEGNRRPGRKFDENGMIIYDVEVLNIKIKDEDIEALLVQAQHEAVKQRLEVTNLNNQLEFTRKSEEIDREIAKTVSETKLQQYGLQIGETEKALSADMAQLESEMKKLEKSLSNKLFEQQQQIKINEALLAQKKDANELQLHMSKALMQQRIEELKAEVDAVVQKAGAISPDLVAALQAFGDKALAQKMAESMAPLSIIGGKSIVEVFSNLVKGTNLEKLLLQNKGLFLDGDRAGNE
jgi:major vault protein